MGQENEDMGRMRAALQFPTGGGWGWPMARSYLAGGQARGFAEIAGLVAVAWLLAALPLVLAAAAVFAGGAGLFLLRYPWLIWPGLAVALPFASGLNAGPVSLADLLLAAAVFLWFVDGARRNSLRLKMGFLPAVFALYLLALLLAFPNAINLQKAVEAVIKWVQMLVIILLIQEALSARQVRWLVWGLLAGGALQAGLGLYQFIFRIGPPHFLLLDRFMRAAGTFGQPNPYAGYLGLTLPVAVALFLHFLCATVKRTAAAWARTRALGWTAAYGAAAGIIGLGLLASWSRGGWLGAAASIAVVLLFHSGRMVGGAALAGITSLFLAGGASARFIPTSLTDRLADLSVYLGRGMWEVVQQPITESNFSVIERLAHWIAALRMWELSPWVGVGPGNYGAVYPSVRLLRWEDPLGHAHNIYLNVLAETGLFGLFAYLVLWGGVIGWLILRRRQMRRDCRRMADRGGAAPSEAAAANAFSAWNAALMLGVLGVVVHLSMHHLFDFLYVQGIYLHVALWLGAVAALEKGRSTAKEATENCTALLSPADRAQGCPIGR